MTPQPGAWPIAQTRTAPISDADHAADGAQQDGLAQDHAQHAPAAPADGPQRADLARALQDAHHHGAHHAQAADQDRDGGDAPGKPLQVLRPLLRNRVAGGRRYRHFVVQRLDARHHRVGAAAAAQPDLEEADRALLLGNGLCVFQHHDAARLLHALARLVDADDVIGRAVDAQDIVHAHLERFCPAAADGDLPRRHHGLALDDPVVLHGNTVRRVAVDQEVGQFVKRIPAEHAGIDVGDIRQPGDALAECLVQAAEGHVVGVFLGHEQVVAEPQRTAVVVGNAIGHGAERHHCGYADRDTEDCQCAACCPPQQVVQNHGDHVPDSLKRCAAPILCPSNHGLPTIQRTGGTPPSWNHSKLLS